MNDQVPKTGVCAGEAGQVAGGEDEVRGDQGACPTVQTPARGLQVVISRVNRSMYQRILHLQNAIAETYLVNKSHQMHVTNILGQKLLLPMGCVKLGEKNCVHLPSVGEQTAN